MMDKIFIIVFSILCENSSFVYRFSSACGYTSSISSMVIIYPLSLLVLWIEFLVSSILFLHFRANFALKSSLLLFLSFIEVFFPLLLLLSDNRFPYYVLYLVSDLFFCLLLFSTSLFSLSLVLIPFFIIIFFLIDGICPFLYLLFHIRSYLKTLQFIENFNVLNFFALLSLSSS